MKNYLYDVSRWIFLSSDGIALVRRIKFHSLCASLYGLSSNSGIENGLDGIELKFIIYRRMIPAIYLLLFAKKKPMHILSNKV